MKRVKVNGDFIMDIKTIAIIGISIGAGALFAYEWFRPNEGRYFLNKIDSRNKEEIEGYLNGLVRGSGSREAAQTNLDQWRTWWLGQKADQELISYWYNYGMKRIGALYG